MSLQKADCKQTDCDASQPPFSPSAIPSTAPSSSSPQKQIPSSHFRWWSSAPDDWGVLDDIVERLIQPSGIDDA
jgi:hypothetical protein